MFILKTWKNIFERSNRMIIPFLSLQENCRIPTKYNRSLISTDNPADTIVKIPTELPTNSPSENMSVCHGGE